MKQRIFTYKEARKVLPDIMRLTSRYREEMEHIWSQINDEISEKELAREFQRLDRIKTDWMIRIRELGAIPFRLWDVGFNSGDGFAWSWRLGEIDLLHAQRSTIGYFPDRIRLKIKR